MLIRLANPTMPRWLLGEAPEPTWLRASLPVAHFPHLDDDEDDEGGDGSEDEDEEEDDESEEEGDEPDKDKQIASLQRALKKANRDAARNRRRAAAGDKSAEDDAEKDDERVEKLEKEIWTRDAIEELREAGVTGSKDQLKRYVRMLDSIAPDDLEDSIDKLEEDMPHLFRKKPDDDKPAPRRRATTRRRADDKADETAKPVISPTTRAMFKQMGIRVPRS